MTNSAAPAGVRAGEAGLTAGQARVTAERAAAQLLSGPLAGRAEEVAGRLLAIQGQDPRGARLAVRVRSQGLSAADIDHALTVDRTLVISWLNRGTLHLVRSEDYWPLHRLTTPQLETGCARRLAQEGIPPAEADRAAGLIERFLASEGPLTRAQLAGRLTAAGVRTQGQALVYLLFLTSLRGISVRGPMIGKQHAYVLARDWLGAPPAAADPDAALGWLARRYLAGHAPATDRDLAKWAGLPLRDARRALREIAADLVEGAGGLVRLAGAADGTAAGDGSAPAAGADRPAGAEPAGVGRAGGSRASVAGRRAEPALPPPRLLGVFDPLLHGWQSREAVLGRHEPEIVRGGMFRSFALAGGRAVGTWALAGQPGLADPAGTGERRAPPGPGSRRRGRAPFPRPGRGGRAVAGSAGQLRDITLAAWRAPSYTRLRIYGDGEVGGHHDGQAAAGVQPSGAGRAVHAPRASQAPLRDGRHHAGPGQGTQHQAELRLPVHRGQQPGQARPHRGHGGQP